MLNSVELFSGAGGLALGISRAGFKHLAVVEWDKDSCRTLRQNRILDVDYISDWPIIQEDVRKISFKDFQDSVTLVAGGPPCQPFSIGGKHKGPWDERDMFPEAVRAVREIRPKVFIFENVKGLLRESFAKYYEYIILQLSYPDLKRKSGEAWKDHLSKLERHHTFGRRNGLAYRVLFQVLNAADYGVPQKRERVFIVGIREDLNMEWSFPKPTHSKEALIWDQWILQDYWERHRIAKNKRPLPPPEFRRVANGDLFFPDTKPWCTVRDAIADLPDPESNRRSRHVPNHILIQGARKYAGHTGSSLDEPAKTLKAGDHGVPGGENMLVKSDRSVRYFTVRESARLQTFPDEYIFPCSWTESMRQVGNAVAVNVAYIIASKLKSSLSKIER